MAPASRTLCSPYPRLTVASFRIETISFNASAKSLHGVCPAEEEGGGKFAAGLCSKAEHVSRVAAARWIPLSRLRCAYRLSPPRTSRGVGPSYSSGLASSATVAANRVVSASYEKSFVGTFFALNAHGIGCRC